MLEEEGSHILHGILRKGICGSNIKIAFTKAMKRKISNCTMQTIFSFDFLENFFAFLFWLLSLGLNAEFLSYFFNSPTLWTRSRIKPIFFHTSHKLSLGDLYFHLDVSLRFGMHFLFFFFSSFFFKNYFFIYKATIL